MENLSCPPQKFLTIKKKLTKLSKQKKSQKIDKFPGTYLWLDLRNYSEFTSQQSTAKVIKLLNRYYFLIENGAAGFGGQVVDFLGDGIGVLFRHKNHPQNAWQAVMCILRSLNTAKLDLKLGLGLNTGLIIWAKSKQVKATKEFYSGTTIIKACRLGVLASRTKKKILITKKFYQKLEPGDRKKFKFLKFIRLKGFKQKTAVYYL